MPFRRRNGPKTARPQRETIRCQLQVLVNHVDRYLLNRINMLESHKHEL